MKRFIYHLCPIVLLLFHVNLFSQLMEVTNAVTPPITPENLITNIFLGEGVEVLSVNFEGDPISIGYFTKGLQAVGLERGILLTSGRASSPTCTGGPFGANCGGTQFASNANNSNAFDPDLNAIANGTLNDVAKFTITFRPNADTLRFRYVFASEEYPEWACSQFNDVFGFFISGPGISGPYQNNGINIARIPGTNIPVSINNIHPANGPTCPPSFAQYYNDHTTSAAQPVYDGYLDVFTAEAVVIPCEVYTIKLLLCDVGDDIYDTGVFLEAKSFGTGSLQVKTATVSLDGTVTEGCASGSVSFSFPVPVDKDFPLDYTIIGTAQNGVDYLPIPTNLFIPAGDSSLTIDIVGIVDNVNEPLESIGIDIQRDFCNRDTFWLFIRDNEILPPDLGDNFSICKQDTQLLNGALPIPLPDPQVFSNTQDFNVTHLAPTYSPIVVAGVQPVTLGPGVIRSVCVNIDHKWVDDLNLYLISPGGQFVELSTFNGANCDNYRQVCFTPAATTNIGYGWPWTPCGPGEEPPFNGHEWLPEGVWSDLWNGSRPTNGTWQLLVIDTKQGFDGTLLDWSITFEPLYQVYYQWQPAHGLSCDNCPDPLASPESTTTYTLKAWDTYGCEVYDSITIEVFEQLPAPAVLCSAITDNSITFSWNDVPNASGYEVSINGGAWIVPNNGSLSHSIAGLNFSDTISIQVIPLGVCGGEIGSATCFTPACPAPTATIIGQTDASCPGASDGAVVSLAAGGSGSYTYSLGAQTNTTGSFQGLPAGTYSLQAWEDPACPVTLTVTIGQPTPIDLQPLIQNNVSCFGNTDASATVKVSGGTYPYNFLWENGQSDSIAYNLPPAYISVVVTDAHGCSESLTLEITEPSPILLQATADSVTCFGLSNGKSTVAAMGGTQPYLYQWDASAGNQTSPAAQNLAAGTYSVLVTDLNGCQQTATVTVGQPPAMNTNTSVTATKCANSNDGSASVTASGGEGGYSYFWSNGDSQATALMLQATTYYVTVADANSCTVVDSVVVSSPPLIDAALTPSAVACQGESTGSIAAQASGGTGGFSYSWSNGGSAANLTAVAAGNYCLTVTDAAGCTATFCTDVAEPEKLSLATTAVNPACHGGSDGVIDLAVSGGIAPYTYNWSHGSTAQDPSGLQAGVYSVVVTDANGCTQSITQSLSENAVISIQPTHTNVSCKNGNNGTIDLAVSGGAGGFSYFWLGPNGFTSTQQNIINLPAGTYALTVKDANQCTATTIVTVQEPATAVATQINPPALICYGAANGVATVSGSGGTPPYSFSWSNGQTGNTASNLTANTYAVTTTDAAGCTATTQVQIVQQELLSLSLTQSATSCHNGSDGTATIQTIQVGGTAVPAGGYNIQWSIPGQNTTQATGLAAGQFYSVTITDKAIGCTATAGITIGNPAPVVFSVLNTQDVSCFGGKDGSASVGAGGGAAPYQYQWSVNANSQTGATAIQLPAESFTVTITDSKGCTSTGNVQIGQPPQLGLQKEIKQVNCAGGSDGVITVKPQGGSLPYTVQWSSGQTGTSITNLPAGTYSLTLTDGKGCTLEENTTLVQPQQPLVGAATPHHVSCPGLKDGMVRFDASGGTPPYQYSLDGINFNGSTLQLALSAGTYKTFVKDKNGCLLELESITITEPPAIAISLGPDTLVLFGTTLWLTPSIINAFPDDLSYHWSSNNPQTQPLHPDSSSTALEVFSPATVRLVVADENGCTASDLLNIFVREVRSIQVPTGFSPNGDGLNDLLLVHGSSLMVEKIRLFRVFDRWGELLFELRDFNINDNKSGWDGNFRNEKMPPGVYVWYLEVDFVDGTSNSFRGHTTLIR